MGTSSVKFSSSTLRKPRIVPKVINQNLKIGRSIENEAEIAKVEAELKKELIKMCEMI